MNKFRLWLTILIGALSMPLLAIERFPRPQFDGAYVTPVTCNPMPGFALPAWGEAALLLAVMCVMTWLVLRVRRRWTIVVLSLLCLAWYGFIRRGCICPVGATQSTIAALTGIQVVDWLSVFFCMLPLAFALLFGRIFCAGVCPLGALQDIFILKPIQLPHWLDRALRMIPVIVLIAAVVCVLNDAGWLICRTDPFVGFFRRCGTPLMLSIGIGLLLLGTVIARPYCRYFCPYGVLLSWATFFAWHKPVITERECINCNLCKQTCPTDAIIPSAAPVQSKHFAKLFRTFVFQLVLLPFVILLCGLAGYAWASVTAQQIPAVAIGLAAENPSPEMQPEIDALIAAGITPQEAQTAGLQARNKFVKHGAVGGLLVGLIFGIRLVLLARTPKRPHYSIDHSLCTACGRCYSGCPLNRSSPKVKANV